MTQRILPNDQQWMRHALALAARGKGFVEPNPMVGCVIVRDGKPLAEGYHEKFGGPHAERQALAALPADCDPAGATWYVTLEPCCHTGKTPPCSDAVIAARPQRVVIAAVDPFSEVAGGGIAQIRAAGIDVEVGVCEAEANRLNAPFIKRVRQQKSWVIAKWAMTLDGKIATHSGNSQWISGEASRRRVHEVRGQVDAIVTGIGSVLADDPTLTARPPGPRTAARIVLDDKAELPLNSTLIKTRETAPVYAVVRSDAPQQRIDALRKAGVGVIVNESRTRSGGVEQLLTWCHDQGMTNLFLEAGAGAMASFFEADAIDEYHVYVAPKLIGGSAAPGPLGGQGLATIAESPAMEPLQVESIDGDLFITTRRTNR
ncbi:bifunctional diaminohydroxyphosphoribosylaminopyrimidine deaminase/5-amino-6-(5-phosphoribosylamino)uracil reductase RibD [Rosistilla oblonga]|uniref:Riboflavin biosynthesis protein RibD n=1 Tax=Rosistilla oblonga TaxID=2527990 RepID=A0A518J1H8_9BACT|nr:bifunctional diaminohydroxyphosphoribosylaminopyrimidine deaminase/5-amino-6-(5-phosphoribosylamino)uracil reductase RibD [Rosistilla oblonga]QDV59178.1 Riboflavin biosynthesis protein RibD [Rosistilla oblonga]